MNRSVEATGEVLSNSAEVVLELTPREVETWALEVELLLRGLSDRLTVRGDGGKHVVLTLDKGAASGRGRALRPDEHTFRFDLPANQLGYLQRALLVAYRDGVAEVNHIHIETDAGAGTFDLTVMFEVYRPPMPGEEATRRLLAMD
ncbi:MAG: hypothetical protein R3F14_00040 [Polyangiaceae bacterium]